MHFAYSTRSSLLGFLAAVSFLCFGLSCGKSKGDDKAGNGTADDGNWLVGTWQGTYGNKGEGMSLNDPAEAQVDFDGSRNFKITLTETPAANATGTWEDYPGESLMLHIKESSISRLGASNTTQQLKYERRGDKVTIYSDKVILMAKKAGGADPSKPNQPSNPLVALWKCTDPSRNQWALDIKSETDFWGTITRDSSKDLVIKGTIATGTDANKELRFTVKDSNSDTVKGSEFLGYLRDPGLLDIVILSKAADGSTTQGDKFSCHK